jgi:hypothetical protein
LPLVGSLVGHLTQDVGAKRSVISSMGSAQSRDAIALREPMLAGVVADPPEKLSQLGERPMEFAASGVPVGGLIEEASDPTEMILGQSQHVAPASRVIHGP